MIHTYLRDEIVLRLSAQHLRRSKLKAICRHLDIDFEEAMNPTPSLTEVVDQLTWRGALPFNGSVPFEFETRCGNHIRQVLGRVVYASEGLNEIGQIGNTISTCQTLVWDPGEPAPEWQQMPENALPYDLVDRLGEAVFDAFTKQQRQQPAAIDSEA